MYSLLFLLLEFDPGQQTKFHFSFWYEAGFYKLTPSLLKLHPTKYGITAHARTPSYIFTIVHFMLLIQTIGA
jgi:hypothetical protein